MSRALPHGHFMGALNRSVSAGGFDVDLRVATLPPEAVEEHSHGAAHFIMPLADRYRSLAHDRLADRHVFGAGSAIYNPPGVVHRDCFDVPGGLFLSVTAPADLPAALDHPLLLHGPAECALQTLVGLTLSMQPADSLRIEDEALVLVGQVSGGADTSRHAPDWLGTAVELVNDLATCVGLEVRTVAAQVRVHPVHLARAWRCHLGISPGSAIRHRRAQQAAACLAQRRSLADVAASAGYSDQSHMTREYVRIFGITPGAFQAAIS